MKLIQKIQPGIKYLLAIAMVNVMLANQAFAQSATAQTRVQTTVDTILSIVQAIGIGVITITFMVSGYLIATGQKQWKDLMAPAGGAIIAGSAATLAAWFFSGS